MKRTVTIVELDARKLRVLGAIVETYIRTGDPVGSKWVAQQLGGLVSPATIRNDMAALFDMGLIEQPHTSSGRIPSHLGFRVYIDRLMPVTPLSQEEKDQINAIFNVLNPDPDRLLEDAAKVLARLTGCAAVCTTYIPQGVTVRQLNLIGVGSRTVVILLVASNGIIKNKVCRVDFNVTQELLTFFNSFAAGRLVGMSINDLAEGYLSAASVALGEYAQVFNSILSAIFDLCREVSGGQYYQSGASNLLAYDELRQGARDVFQLLQNRAAVWEMIFSQQKEPLQIRVGRENPSQELADFSLMVCRYNIDKDNTGAIGILGPVRMDYARLVPHLEYFAQTLGKLLADTMDGH